MKESVLKMSALVDQTDESELLPPQADDVQAWMQSYFLAMGAAPEQEGEPTEAQLAGALCFMWTSEFGCLSGEEL